MDDDVKQYHFEREYREGVVPKEPTKKDTIENSRERLLESFRILNDKVREIQDRKYLSEKMKKTLEVAEEFMEQCKEGYGDQLQKLYKEEQIEKVKSLEQIVSRILQELKQYKLKEFVGEVGVSQYIKNKGKDINQTLEHEGIVMMEESDFGNIKTVQRSNFYLDTVLKKEEEEKQQEEQEER